MTNSDTANHAKGHDHVHVTYKLYPSRHLMLFLYSIAAIINNVSNYIYIPIQTTIASIFNLNLAWVSFFTNYISNFTYLPAVPFANYLADKKGLRNAVNTGTFLTLVSWWLCVGCKVSFFFMPFGQSIFGFGFPFFNMPQKLSGEWYGPHERDIATSVFNMFYQLAASIGALIPQFFVDPNATNEEALDQIFNMLLWTSIVSTILALPIFIFMKSKPPTPPSNCSEVIEPDTPMIKLLRNTNYTTLLIGTSLTIATYLAFVGNVQPLFAPFGVSQGAISWMVTGGVIAACFGSFFMGLYISKWKKYKAPALLTTIAASIICTAMMFYTQYGSNEWIIGGGFIIYQFILSASLPLSWEFLIEVSFPAGEATAGSLMMTIAQQGGAVMGVIISYLLNNQTVEMSEISFYIIIGFHSLAAIIILFVKEDLKRLKYEQGSLLQRRRSSKYDPEGRRRKDSIGAPKVLMYRKLSSEADIASSDDIDDMIRDL